jgi:lipopolysaccharide assembly outer membrane protein LptD (OstA)
MHPSVRHQNGMLRRLVVSLIMCSTVCAVAFGQDGAPPVDTLAQPAVVPAAVDTVAPTSPSRRVARSSGLQRSVQFTARDSIIISFDDIGGDQASLFGDTNVRYGDAALEAYHIDILFDIDELRAGGLETQAGRIGFPRFQQGSEAFEGSRLAYNLRTERGRIVDARTTLDDGFVRAGVVKVTEDTTLYVQRGVYSTCECIEDPSYSLRSNRMKIVDQEWIYTGPIQLYIFNIPTPLWLPFGFLPAREGRRSGPLPPRYGEDDRGFYLRDFGWYFALNDYMDAQLQAGVWSRGSWAVNPMFRYARRDAYSGNLMIDYSRNRSGEPRDPDYQVFDSATLRWSHQQTINPTSSFGGNVNLSTTNYLRAISERYEDRVTQTVSSNVRYNKRWPSQGRSLTLSATHQQNLALGSANLSLPSMTFSQSSRTPFRRRALVGNESVLDRLTVSYTGRLDNRFDYRPLPDSVREARGVGDVEWYDALVSPWTYRQATGQETPFRITANHSVPVSTNFTINRIPLIAPNFRMNVTQSFNYTEDWVTETERRRIDQDTNQLVTERQSGFMAVRRFNLGVSTNTTFYGLFPWRIGRFDGLRHTVRPTASFSYSPDFTSDFWGYTRAYVDGQGREVRYPITPIGVGGRQQTLSLSVANVFETRIVRIDNEGDRTSSTFKLLDLNATTSYNFAADSLRLSNVNLNARTRILDQVDISASAVLSPYALNHQTGTLTSRYVFRDRLWLPVRWTQARIDLRTSFRSQAQGASRPFETPRARMGGPMAGPMAGPMDDPFTAVPGSGTMSPGGLPLGGVGYADFAIPWSLNLDLNVSATRAGFTLRRNAVVNGSFDFNLTPNWKVQGRTGYDLVQGEIVLTNLVVMRDFECWQLGANWTPFGPYQAWGFDLHVKSGHLRDILRLRQPRRDVGGRFGGALDGRF